LPEARSFVEILVVRADGKRLRALVSAATLDDLSNDAGEQADMDARLRRLIASAREE
jgi:hypothetical protein